VMLLAVMGPFQIVPHPFILLIWCQWGLRHGPATSWWLVYAELNHHFVCSWPKDWLPASKPEQKVMLLAVVGPFQIVPHPFILLIRCQWGIKHGPATSWWLVNAELNHYFVCSWPKVCLSTNSKPDQKVMLLAVMGPFQIVPQPFILFICCQWGLKHGQTTSWWLVYVELNHYFVCSWAKVWLSVSKPDQKVMLLAVMGPFQIVPHPFILFICCQWEMRHCPDPSWWDLSARSHLFVCSWPKVWLSTSKHDQKVMLLAVMLGAFQIVPHPFILLIRCQWGIKHHLAPSW
jgi:hypothetical protein